MLSVSDPPKRPVAVFHSPGTDGLARALFCSGAGVQDVRTSLAARRLGSHAAVLVDRGTGWLESESGGRIRIAAPSLFFLFPGELHSYGPDPGTAWHEHWVLFGGTLTAAFAEAGMIDRSRPQIALESPARLAALFARIRRELLGGSRLAGASAAAILHELIVETRRVADRAGEGTADGSARPIAEAIRAGAEGRIDFAGLAQRFDLSPATLRRRMVSAYGLSPKAYQLRLRIDRAKELLATGELSVEAVARAVGFDDAYYFSRLFRNREGLSPSRFRAENRRG